ncbi:hypothetical protein LIER_38306 [Lithospermum erythrorhizon]|uniref:Helitron helicase-like domain-containing protein n=1 Tax=Lithospermum erythrorhizon TaxID=34254 RepID=A0AAV3PZB6_LITER
MRSKLCQGIVDIIIKGEARASEIGERIILPSSFVGGSTDMRRRYLDAMSLVQRFGKPDLLITMTCEERTTKQFKSEMHILTTSGLYLIILIFLQDIIVISILKFVLEFKL